MTITLTDAVPFLDLAAQQAEIAEEVLPVWQAQLRIGIVRRRTRRSLHSSGSTPSTSASRHVVGVSNGTDALELAYRAVGVEPGDEVIMPANTFIATAEAASRVGAVPVFVDVDDEHLLIDPDAVEAAITPRTRAIVAGAPVRTDRADGADHRARRASRSRGDRGCRAVAGRRSVRRAGRRAGARGGHQLLPRQEPGRRRRRRRRDDRRRRHRRVWCATSAHTAAP